MKDLAKWQAISFISRGMATFLGLFQTFIILRILTQAEWGMVQLATSIGGALGIYQHLGLASASTREISSSKDDTHIFKIFVTSVAIRYVVTLPLAFGLFFFADHLAVSIYKHPEIAFPLKVYGITLLFQGFQSILNSVISGTKRFKHLFLYQVGIAGVSVLLFVPFVYFLKIPGYFYAFIAFNIINTICLWFLAFKPLKGKLIFPSKKDFVMLFKEIFSISIAIYIVKVIYTNWEKLGTNVLGLNNTAETIAVFSFALLFAKKIMSISDSVTDVNLPVLSEKFSKDFKDFKETFCDNFNKVFSFIVLSAAVAVYWAPQIVYVLLGKFKYFEYADSFRLILPLLFAFILYSLLDIVKSSVLIPAKMTKEMLIGFATLLVATGASFIVLSRYTHFFDSLFSMSLSMAIGSVVALIYVGYVTNEKLKFMFFNIDHVLVLLQFLFIGILGVLDNLIMKGAMFIPFMILLFWGISVSKFLTKHDLLRVKNKLLGILHR